MDSHHHDIVRLAWSRHLGLADSALTPGRRYTRVDDDATSVTFLRLGDSSALVGPHSAVSALSGSTDDELAAHLASHLPANPAGVDHASGPVILSFADDIETTIPRHDPLISRELSHVLALEALCAPDDVLAADLTHKRSWFTLLGDDRPADSAEPLAAAGYLEWEGLLADVGVLTAPQARRAGHAHVVARLATNDAFDEGMIPQWRVDADNTTSRRLAARLGYEEWGVFASVSVR